LGLRLRGLAHAAMDVSDGLIADLGHICETSGCAATVALAKVPFSTAALTILADAWVAPEALVTGGDDYELLFAAPPEADAEILSLSQSLGLPITEIGEIVAGEGVRLVDAEGAEIPVAAGGWRHF
jgi:thiamine-monophosphate kinase